MRIEEAEKRLRQHALLDDNLNAETMENGFLGSLRPFSGHLNPENFHDVMACISVLYDALGSKREISRELVASLWSICHFARAWGVDPNGMLRSNNLISPQQVETLSNWIDQISYSVCMLLSEADKEVAFEGYRE